MKHDIILLEARGQNQNSFSFLRPESQSTDEGLKAEGGVEVFQFCCLFPKGFELGFQGLGISDVELGACPLFCLHTWGFAFGCSGCSERRGPPVMHECSCPIQRGWHADVICNMALGVPSPKP